jgi:glyoxylase-like metal-dependent hydrolase (beta-lactamase superfamily II)
MKLSILETGNFMLDGGAMFGVVPKTLWSRHYPANERNLCNLSLRCLLIESGNRKILVDTGLGSKQDAKFFGYYYLNGTSNLEGSLQAIGIAPGEITDVVHTHLHLDHCGGTVKLNGEGQPELLFPGARHYVSKTQWKWMLHPNPLERPSYLAENILPMKDSGKMEFLEGEKELAEGVSFKLFNGHTAGLTIPFISFKGSTIVFISDLIPLMAQLPLSWICGYDIQPLETFREKEKFLNEAADNSYILLFQHDLYHQACSVMHTEKGVRLKEEFIFTELGIAHIA